MEANRGKGMGAGSNSVKKNHVMSLRDQKNHCGGPISK